MFAVHAYYFMPDHIHALVEGNAPESDLLLFVRNFKRMSSREYFKATGQQLWQKKFYDHVLRTKDSPDAVSWHIWMNPVRKGLSDEPTEYPLSGSFTGAWRHMIQPEEVGCRRGRGSKGPVHHSDGLYEKRKGLGRVRRTRPSEHVYPIRKQR